MTTGLPTQSDRIGPHWASDVLEVFLDKIDELFLEPVTHLPVGVFGKADAARIGLSASA